MPELVIVAGPNGAGKTTFANEYLSDEVRFVFVNADEIARRAKALIEPDLQGHPDIHAGRIMLDRIDELIDARADIVIETTLASLTYARKIPIWREQGYHISLIYLRLDSADESLDRVRKRVAAGGHNIPEQIIRRRFRKSVDYLEKIYKPIVNEWYVWESREGKFNRLEASKQ